jgi:hypothetical protein
MKGVVFTEFLEMVEQTWSAELADDLIDGSDLPSGGVYTAVGTYDHREIVQLVQALSERTATPVPDLVRAFGGYLFGRFVVMYPQFFETAPTAFDLLASLDRYVHREVVKLYPDAEVPRFDTTRTDAATLEMIYRSPRGMEDLAEGLIRAAIAHYGESLDLSREVVRDAVGPGVRFTLRHAA